MSSLVGVVDIAKRFEVASVTVHKWRERPIGFPQPVSVVSGRPAWDEDEVIDWGIATGRLEEEK